MNDAILFALIAGWFHVQDLINPSQREIDGWFTALDNPWIIINQSKQNIIKGSNQFELGGLLTIAINLGSSPLIKKDLQKDTRKFKKIIIY